jgi:hypothetical protein
LARNRAPDDHAFQNFLEIHAYRAARLQAIDFVVAMRSRFWRLRSHKGRLPKDAEEEKQLTSIRSRTKSTTSSFTSFLLSAKGGAAPNFAMPIESKRGIFSNRMVAGSLFRSDPLFLLARNPELDDHACQHLLDANGFGGL